jgi:hypothetical protein
VIEDRAACARLAALPLAQARGSPQSTLRARRVENSGDLGVRKATLPGDLDSRRVLNKWVRKTTATPTTD